MDLRHCYIQAACCERTRSFLVLFLPRYHIFRYRSQLILNDAFCENTLMRSEGMLMLSKAALIPTAEWRRHARRIMQLLLVESLADVLVCTKIYHPTWCVLPKISHSVTACDCSTLYNIANPFLGRVSTQALVIGRGFKILDLQDMHSKPSLSLGNISRCSIQGEPAVTCCCILARSEGQQGGLRTHV